jgi:hypothetical protein
MKRDSILTALKTELLREEPDDQLIGSICLLNLLAIARDNGKEGVVAIQLLNIVADLLELEK